MASEATAKRANEKDKADKPAEAAAPLAHPDPGLFSLVADLKGNRSAYVIVACVVLANIPLVHYFFRHVLGEQPVTATVPFDDNFDRADLGNNYWFTGGDYRLEEGWLHSPDAHNNPAWVQAKLPDNVAIEFDVRAASNEGDVRFELGDGLNHSVKGYLFVLGGYNNQVSFIAKIDERAPAFNAEGLGLQGQSPEQNEVAGKQLAELMQNGTLGTEGEWRIERRDFHLNPGQAYHVRVERKGGELTWYVDGQVLLHVNDLHPLVGTHHDRFGFSSSETDSFFDNLAIRPL